MVEAATSVTLHFASRCYQCFDGGTWYYIHL